MLIQVERLNLVQDVSPAEECTRHLHPTKVKDDVNVRFVRPATLDGMSVQARKSAMTKGTVMKYLKSC